MLKNDYMKEVENTLELVKEEVDKNIIEGNVLEARNRLNKSIRGLIGLDICTIDVLSVKSIEELISKEKQYNTEKYIAFGELMKLEGMVSQKENNENEKINYYEKSLEGFYKAYTEDDTIDTKYLEDAAEVAEELSQYKLPIETDKKIFKIYELANKFDKAEDILFYMLRKTENDSNIFLEGISFYNRLKEKSHEDLISGNLPLEEVEDGIKELERRRELE